MKGFAGFIGEIVVDARERLNSPTLTDDQIYALESIRDDLERRFDSEMTDEQFIIATALFSLGYEAGQMGLGEGARDAMRSAQVDGAKKIRAAAAGASATVRRSIKAKWQEKAEAALISAWEVNPYAPNEVLAEAATMAFEIDGEMIRRRRDTVLALMSEMRGRGLIPKRIRKFEKKLSG